jgi:hypothetical protein
VGKVKASLDRSGNLHALFNGNHNAAAFYPRRGYQTPAKSGSR